MWTDLKKKTGEKKSIKEKVYKNTHVRADKASDTHRVMYSEIHVCKIIILI